MSSTADADEGVIADEPNTSSKFDPARDQPTSPLTRHVAAVWNNLRKSRSIRDVDMQFETIEYGDEMTMDSLIKGKEATIVVTKLIQNIKLE